MKVNPIEQKEIGVAVLNYDGNGAFVNATFTPTIGVEMDAKDMEFFKKVDCNQSEDNIKAEAEAVFATWFQSLNEVELADREFYTIATELTRPCEYWDNGKIKSVSPRFIFKQLI